MKIIKKNLPNILTISRIIVTPLIIYLGINKLYVPLIITFLFIALTDYFDGYFARRFNVTSTLGAKLDTIADKILALSLLIILIMQNKVFIIIFILEFLIAISNIYYYWKTKIVESIFIGKVKTWLIFITMLIGLLKIIFTIRISFSIFVILTMIFQIICLIQYFILYIKNKSMKKDSKVYKEYTKIVEDILHHPEFLKRKEFTHHYNESVYDHVLKVSYDCFLIGKKLHLDYKALAIAGLLHDFYPNPWQSNKKKKKLLQKHGFVHAHEARINAQKYFSHLLTPKIESMIETHMFPLNKVLPKSKEAWLLTLVDKADSLEFLMHPLLFVGLTKEKNLKRLARKN